MTRDDRGAKIISQPASEDAALGPCGFFFEVRSALKQTSRDFSKAQFPFSQGSLT